MNKKQSKKKVTFTQDEVEEIAKVLFEENLKTSFELVQVKIENIQLLRKLQRVPRWLQRVLGIHK